MELFHNTVSFVSIAYFWFTVVVLMLVGVPALAGIVHRPIREKRLIYEVLVGGLLQGYASCFTSLWKAIATVLGALMVCWAIYDYHGAGYAAAYLAVELTYYMVCYTVRMYYVP